MTKKIKDLTLKEFYLFIEKQMKEMEPYCFMIKPIDALKEISIENYLKEKGENEVELEND